MANPLISVCIPAYNRASLLPFLLDSILDQDYHDYEIIISDDCSPEHFLIQAKTEEYRYRYGANIKYYLNPKTLGYDGNLRRLLELATGDYVLFMGNDDLLAPGSLRAVADAIQLRSDIGVVLRSYASFTHDPGRPLQVFRYFDQDRLFPPGPETIVTFFRRSVFISGMVFKRTSAIACSTSKFDGTLLYQQHLVGQILNYQSGIYLTHILSFHRLGGVPDFGVSTSEQGLFVPKEQTPQSSVQFMRGMLAIAFSLDDSNGDMMGRRILHDIGNYSYPALAIQAGHSYSTFLVYIWQLMQLGFWRVPLFYVYAIGLLILGRSKCDSLIAQVKKRKGRAPLLGKVYVGEKCEGGGY